MKDIIQKEGMLPDALTLQSIQLLCFFSSQSSLLSSHNSFPENKYSSSAMLPLFCSPLYLLVPRLFVLPRTWRNVLTPHLMNLAENVNLLILVANVSGLQMLLLC